MSELVSHPRSGANVGSTGSGKRPRSRRRRTYIAATVPYIAATVRARSPRAPLPHLRPRIATRAQVRENGVTQQKRSCTTRRVRSATNTKCQRALLANKRTDLLMVQRYIRATSSAPSRDSASLGYLSCYLYMDSDPDTQRRGGGRWDDDAGSLFSEKTF